MEKQKGTNVFSKRKNTLKMIVASVTTVCLCSALFVAANSAVLAAAFNKTEVIPTEYNTPPTALVSVSDDYVKGDYKVVELENPASKSSKARTYGDAISREDAAEVGAQYLWELYRADLSGKTIQMYYFVEPERLRAYWAGNVYESEDDINNLANYKVPSYGFIVDAVTGEVTSIGRGYESFSGDKKIPFHPERTKELWKNNCDEHLQLAKEIGEKHLGAKIVSAEFKDIAAVMAFDEEINDGTTYESDTVKATSSSTSTTSGREKFKQRDPNADVSASCVMIVAIVTDEYGRQCEVVITTDTKEIVSINTIVPADPNGVKGVG